LKIARKRNTRNSEHQNAVVVSRVEGQVVSQ